MLHHIPPQVVSVTFDEYKMKSPSLWLSPPAGVCLDYPSLPPETDITSIQIQGDLSIIDSVHLEMGGRYTMKWSKDELVADNLLHLRLIDSNDILPVSKCQYHTVGFKFELNKEYIKSISSGTEIDEFVEEVVIGDEVEVMDISEETYFGRIVKRQQRPTGRLVTQWNPVDIELPSMTFGTCDPQNVNNQKVMFWELMEQDYCCPKSLESLNLRTKKLSDGTTWIENGLMFQSGMVGVMYSH